MFLFHDYLGFWAAGRLALAGLNPYDDSLIINELLAAGVPLTHHPGEFGYPPWSIWLFSSFSIFSLDIAQILWFAGMLFLIGYSAIAILEIDRGIAISKCLNKSPWVVLFIAFAFYPAQKAILFGQSTHIVLAGLVVFFRMIYRSKPFAAGLGLSLATLKFHLLLPAFLIILVRCMRRGNLGIIYGCISGLAVQCLMSLMIAPHVFTGYLVHLKRFFEVRSHVLEVTLGHALNGIFNQHYMIEITVISGLCFALVLSLSKQETQRLLLEIGIPLSLLTAPYAWSHDHLLLLPSLVYLISRWFKDSLRFARLLLVLFTMGCWVVVIGDIGQKEVYLVVVPISFTILGVYNWMRTTKLAVTPVKSWKH